MQYERKFQRKGGIRAYKFKEGELLDSEGWPDWAKGAIEKGDLSIQKGLKRLVFYYWDMTPMKIIVGDWLVLDEKNRYSVYSNRKFEETFEEIREKVLNINDID